MHASKHTHLSMLRCLPATVRVMVMLGSPGRERTTACRAARAVSAVAAGGSSGGSNRGLCPLSSPATRQAATAILYANGLPRPRLLQLRHRVEHCRHSALPVSPAICFGSHRSTVV